MVESRVVESRVEEIVEEVVEDTTSRCIINNSLFTKTIEGVNVEREPILLYYQLLEQLRLYALENNNNQNHF